MKNRIMHKDFAKAFRLILVIFIVLAVFTAVAIPLSLSQQISDASHFRQQAQATDMTEHQAERALKSSITPLNATNYLCNHRRTRRSLGGTRFVLLV